MIIFKRILDAIVRMAEVVLMCFIAGISILILNEIFIRNVLNKSFRGVVEVAIFFFVWVVLLGFMVNFDKRRLVALDTLYVTMKGRPKIILWYFQEIVAIFFGIAMIVSFIGLFPYYKNLYFSTMPKISRIWQHFPLVISGGFVAAKGLYNILEQTLGLKIADNEGSKE